MYLYAKNEFSVDQS